MPIVRQGIMTSDEAFGKRGTEFWNTIKEMGWKQTPFLTSIQNGAPVDRSTNAAAGHTWFYDETPDGEADNAHLEGGAPAALKYATGGQLKNQYQIVKNTYGVSGTEEDSKRVDGNLILTKNGEMEAIRHKKTLEKILLSDQTAVQRVNTGVKKEGKLGGLKSFTTATNTFDATGADMSMQFIRDLLKIGHLRGLPYDFILLPDKQMDRVMDLLDKYKQANYTVEYLHDKVTAINSQYGENVKLLLSPELANNEIIAYRSEDIYAVYWRMTKKKDLPTENDEIKKEILTELTLRVCTPVAFAWLKNLKV